MSVPAPIALEANRVRIDLDGAALCDQLTFKASGARMVIAGAAAAALSACLAGRARVTAGSLLLAGRAVGRAEPLDDVGIAPSEMPLPAGVNVAELIALSFRLAGMARLQARAAALATLELLGIAPLARRTTSSLSIAERRSLAVAQAMLPGGCVLWAEAPLAALEPPAARAVLGVLGAASRNRPTVVSVTRMDAASPEHELLMGADCVVVLHEHDAAWVGDPVELMRGGRMVALVVRGNAQALAEKLSSAGASAAADGARVRVFLPEGADTRMIGAAALDAEAAVIEMIPLPAARAAT